jgi:hypothetical protein
MTPWLVTSFGIVGAALVVLVLRFADVALIVRARSCLSRRQIVAVFSAAALVGLIAAYGRLQR